MAKINPTIFKSYDIRGEFPEKINEEVAFLIGKAFVKFLKKKKPSIVVGRDNRLSSPKLKKALISGLSQAGAKIIDIGLATTPILYFTVAHFGYDGGIQITASHNPPKENGFKLVRERAIPISKKTGLLKIQKIAEKLNLKRKAKKSKLIKKEVKKEYFSFLLSQFNPCLFSGFKVLIDTGNGVAGILIPYLKRFLPIKIYPLFEKLDGRFPHHLPDPSKKENLLFLQKKVIEKKANLGICFDGDGDRILFVDEKGEIVPGDIVTAILAEILLSERPGEKILYDVRSSNVVFETIKKLNGIPIISRIGHSFIKERMRRENILFGGETSGHYYLRDHYFCESPIFVFLKILEKMKKEKKKLSEICEPFKKYFQSGEINFEIKNKEEVLEKLKEKYGKRGKILTIDGLRVDFKDWWFLARPSGTEDLLRVSIEAKTKKRLREKKREIIRFISSLEKELG